MSDSDRRQGDRRESDPDLRLLAYQFEQAEKINREWQGEMSRAVQRLEEKVDGNMEQGWKNVNALDLRVTALEKHSEARDAIERTLEKREDRGFTTLQKVSIIATIIIGAGGLCVAFLAVVATVLVNVLTH